MHILNDTGGSGQAALFGQKGGKSSHCTKKAYHAKAFRVGLAFEGFPSIANQEEFRSLQCFFFCA